MTYVICGSMKQMDEMKNLKDILEGLYGDTAKVILPVPLKCNEFLSEHYETWMENLDRADLIFILTKPDGTIGEATSYELAYCKKNEHPYILVGHELRISGSVFTLKKDEEGTS